MKSIRQFALAVLSFAGTILLSSQCANAQVLSIQSASPNTAQTVLTITGSNFCASPTVTLGGIWLAVTTSIPTQITATLPAFSPSTYYMVVSCGTLAGRTVYFDVTIGAAGSSSPGTSAGGCWVNGQRYADLAEGRELRYVRHSRFRGGKRGGGIAAEWAVQPHGRLGRGQLAPPDQSRMAFNDARAARLDRAVCGDVQSRSAAEGE
jgi:hypothetical protein